MRFIFPAIVVATIASASFSLGSWAEQSALSSSNTITLSDAIKATLQHNPQLRGYEFRANALAGEQQTASLKPQLRLSSQAENIAGSGEFNGVDGGELTLSLSSVLELGGQRDARLGLVTARQQQLESAQRVLTLDLLTEVTQQFIALAAAQEQLKFLQQTQQLAQENITSLNRQVQAGRTPEAELLRAKAGLARTTIAVEKTRQQLNSERTTLSAYWASPQASFSQVDADLFSLPPLVPLTTLANQLDNNPDLAVLGDEVHLRAAELRQAQAERKANVEWSAGVRHLQANDDSALVVGMSMPLGANGRASGAIATASAKQTLAEQERSTARIKLHAQLVSLHGAYTQSLTEVDSLQNEVLPPLQQAMRATTEGFQQGRYSYLELNLAQRELLDAQLALIDSAARAHALSTDIERLTGAALNGALATHSDVKTLP